MTPCLATRSPITKSCSDETFGPLLYLMTYRDFDEAIAIHNDVPQGLTSAIFTNDVREAEKFVSAAGAIAESRTSIPARAARKSAARSVAKKTPAAAARAEAIRWKSYMRRQTNTINFSTELPLAQGIQFGADEGSATA